MKNIFTTKEEKTCFELPDDYLDLGFSAEEVKSLKKNGAKFGCILQTIKSINLVKDKTLKDYSVYIKIERDAFERFNWRAEDSLFSHKERSKVVELFNTLVKECKARDLKPVITKSIRID